MGRVLAVLGIAYSILRLVGSLLLAWLTLSWNVRKARRSFEAELRKEGVSKEDARRLSECYSVLKDQMLDTVKSSFSMRRQRRTS